MRKEDYTIFEYRMSEEVEYADLIHNEKMNGIFKKVCVKTKTAGYTDMSTYRPLSWDGKQILKPVFNFHGGGNVLGYYEQDGRYYRLLADLTGCAIFNIDYVVAPEFKYPKPLFSSYEAIAEIRKRCGEVRIDREHVVVIGHSAGSYISTCLTLINRNRKGFGVEGAILDYPPLRQKTCAEFRKAKDPSEAISKNKMLQYINWCYSSFDGLNDRLASPLLADSYDLLKTLILSAEYDSLKNEEKAYTDKMQKAGGDIICVEFTNCRHGSAHEWFDEFMPGESEKAWNMMAAFIRGIM